MQDKILTLEKLLEKIRNWRNHAKKVVFTNGCFDILHRGHVEYLLQAKSFGDVLIVGINSDESVRRLKGKSRPFVNEDDRTYILSHLNMVDAVVVFKEDTPFELISAIQPDVLVKGGDYTHDTIVGADIVESAGGKVIIIPLVPGKSSTGIIKKISQSTH